MARCNEELFRLLSQKKVAEADEIELRVKRKLNDCRRINAMNPVAVTGTPAPDMYRRPLNRFECNRKGCVNTGLLMMAAANDTATYKTTDSTEFANGVVTFYVYAEGTTFPVAVTFKIGDEQAMTNTDVYNVAITQDMVRDDGFVPIIIRLDDPPASQEGNGWTPSAVGSYIQVTADQIVGYSSFSFQQSLDDFELYDIIKLRCITNAGDDQSLSVLEEKCQDAEYDTNVNTIPFSVTANLVSSNYLRANPMYARGTDTVGFKIQTIRKTVEAYTVGTQNYGRIILSDANQAECARIAVQYQDDCDAMMLTAFSVPVITAIDQGHFLVIDNDDGSTSIIFNEGHVGREFLISYPKTMEVKKSVYSTDFLNDAEASLVWTRHLSNGTEIVDVFDNVFITTFPRNITDTTSAFTWAFSIARAADGNFYYTQEIVA